jgi:hypothetical protein
LAFDGFTSFRGAAGIRLGADVATPAGTASPFIGLSAVDEFDGDGRADFRLGAPTLALTQDVSGTWGQVRGGITFVAGSFEAFARGEVECGGEVDGVSGRLGARLRF